MKIDSILNQIRDTFRDNIDERVLFSEKKYFKEEIKIYGVRVSVVTQISKLFIEIIKHEPKKDIFNLCNELWKSGYCEDAYIACNIAYSIREQYKPEDYNVFRSWMENYVTNWSTCDTLCNHTIGTFVEMYPQYIVHLKQWAQSPNRWMRRGAAVTLIIPARRGLFLNDIFEISDALLQDKDDLVQKGYGWLLKAASEAHLQQVYDYIISKRSIMPCTAYRYALEKMPGEMRADAMKR